MLRTVLCCVSLVVLSLGTVAQAGEVVVAGVHICCDSCVDGINEAFKDVAAVSQVVIDKDAKTVTFTVADADGLKVGLQALAKAGYGGTVQHDGKAVAFPGSKRMDAKVDEVAIRGLHNCCGGCAKSIEAALKGVAGVESVTVKDRVATVKGTQVSQLALILALHGAGLNGTIPKPKVDAAQ